MADTLVLDDALRATYVACVGIDDELADLKKMAGINTAVTGVATAAGAGATVTGLVKASKDKQAEELEELIKELEELSKGATEPTEAELNAFLVEFEESYASASKNIETYKQQLDKTTKQSKNLGNWRTGLMATSAVANVAGTVIASGNKIDGDVKTSINACKAAVVNLRSAMMQARLNGVDISEAQHIADVCGEYDFADLSKVNTKAKGAAISSGIGAATGVVGTIVSATANSDNVRNDNSDGGKKKEKTLNTTANVLAGATTAASATATVFNATQIKAIKNVAEIAEKCTGVLR
jgi:hypothetical protein